MDQISCDTGANAALLRLNRGQLFQTGVEIEIFDPESKERSTPGSRESFNPALTVLAMNNQH